MSSLRFLAAIFSLAALLPSQGFAWENHQILMPLILGSASEKVNKILEIKGCAPCPKDDLAIIAGLIRELHLNPTFHAQTALNPACDPKYFLTVREILKGDAVDEPDFEMDQNLPPDDPAYDPKNFRKWMGGFQGESSQGFRHMYFGGWKLGRSTGGFQFPPGAMGEAPYRAELMAKRAKEFIKSGDLFWGARLAGWAMHYLQDLAQPFHAVQLPSKEMIPWKAFTIWPPWQIVPQIIKEGTRTVSNYHHAYEVYTMHVMKNGPGHIYEPCLRNSEKYSTLKFDPKTQSPKDLAFEVIRSSNRISADLGSAEIKFFGTLLKDPSVDLKTHPDTLNYAQLSSRSDLSEPRRNLDKVTCEALANASLASRFLLEWAFQP